MRKLSISLVAASRETTTADDITTASQLIESAGFYKLYFTDHFFHATASFHSTSAFAAAAVATSRIPLGYCAYIAPLRHAIVAAKELAFLDGLSEGRLEPGLAAGSSQAEFDAFGIPFETRGKRLDECIAAMKLLWTEQSASFEGKYFSFHDVQLDPKPVQKPYPPLWIGSWAGPKAAARRIVEHAVGWQASGLHASLEQGVEGWRNIEAMCAQMGRDPATIGRALVNLVVRVGKDRASALANTRHSHRMHDELILAGPANQIADRLNQIYESGFEEIAVFMPCTDRDQMEALAMDVMPQLS